MTVFEMNVSVGGEIEEAEEEELSTLEISVKSSLRVTNNYNWSLGNPTIIPTISMHSHIIQRPRTCRSRIESGLARSCSSSDDNHLRWAAKELIMALYIESEGCRVTPIDLLAERVASTASSLASSSDWAVSATLGLKLKFRLVAQIEFVISRNSVLEILKPKLIRDAFEKLKEHRLIVPPINQFHELDGDCCICCHVLWDPDNKIETDHLIRLPICKHVFHQNCLFTWFQKSNSCPLCRRLLICS